MHGCFPLNFGKNLRTPSLKSTSGWLLLYKDENSNTTIKTKQNNRSTENPPMSIHTSLQIPTIQSYIKKVYRSPKPRGSKASVLQYPNIKIAILKPKFIEKGYKKNILKDQVEKVDVTKWTSQARKKN